jgi:RNase P subunit RPR2
MKEFYCKKCNKFLGDMEKGRIHKGAVILCTECMSVYESLYNYNKGAGNVGNEPKIDMPDFFKNIFK